MAALAPARAMPRGGGRRWGRMAAPPFSTAPRTAEVVVAVVEEEVEGVLPLAEAGLLPGAAAAAAALLPALPPPHPTPSKLLCSAARARERPEEDVAEVREAACCSAAAMRAAGRVPG